MNHTPEYLREYRVTHHEACSAHSRKYRETHRDEIRERNRKSFLEFQEWLKIMTATHDCAWCGGRAVDWHHVDPRSKRNNVAAMHGYSLDSLEAELEKCVPLCKECHGAYHRKQQIGVV